MKSYKIYLVFLPLMILLSCSEEIKPTPTTYSKLLTGEESKTWRMVALSITIIEGGTKYQIPVENSCADSIDYYDNYYTFYANPERTLEVSEGPEKCDFNETYSLVDTWALDNATATLTFVFLPLTAEFRFPYTIKDLTERKLTIEAYTEKYIYQVILNPVQD